MKCAHEPDCMFSAKKIYLDDSLKGLKSGNTGWPVKILVPDIEECISSGGMEAGEKKILAKLAEDWDENTPTQERDKKQYYGRCVWDADNDVNDDQVVQLSWEDDEASGQGAKNATFHMVAMTSKICQRYTHIYGTTGEIYADSEVITVTDFTKPIPQNERMAKNESAAALETRKYYPSVPEGGHGGGDSGLARQFVLAVDRVKNGEGVEKVQREEIGCDVEEVVRSHALCFAAEEARKGRKVVDFPEWWKREVASEERLYDQLQESNAPSAAHWLPHAQMVSEYTGKFIPEQYPNSILNTVEPSQRRPTVSLANDEMCVVTHPDLGKQNTHRASREEIDRAMAEIAREHESGVGRMG